MSISKFFDDLKNKNNYYDKTNHDEVDVDLIVEQAKQECATSRHTKMAKRLASIRPSNRQLLFHELGYYNFVHFGLNTFTGREWGDGTDPVSIFNPTDLDTDSWCKAFAESGSKGVILTAKHHDGFCLWPTKTTEYSVKNSPYKNGNGDIVAELCNSCKKYNLKLGLYLSPWDRHDPSYGKSAYNDFYIAQLTELLTNYGELFSLWFDGARGADVEMDEGFDYDWKRITETVREYQPNAVMCVMGEDVRWIGNEAGKARTAEWNVVARNTDDRKAIEENSQTEECDEVALVDTKIPNDDIGSRQALLGHPNLVWYPAEADVSLHRGWFYKSSDRPKSLKKLLHIYYNTVGKNASLLLNVPPDKRGRLDDKDVNRLKEFGDKIALDRSNLIDSKVYLNDNLIEALDSEKLDIAKTIEFGDDDVALDIVFDKPCDLGVLELEENLSLGQRVEDFVVLIKRENGSWVNGAIGNTIGSKRLIAFDPERDNRAVALKIVIKKSRCNPCLLIPKVYAPVKEKNPIANGLRILKFVLFSAGAGIIQIVAFTIMNEVAKLPYWPSYLVALTLSVLFNFTLNRKFTFKAANNVPIAMLKVIAYYAVFTPLSTLGGKALTDNGWNEYLVLALTMALNLSTEYLFQRFFVYGKAVDSAKKK